MGLAGGKARQLLFLNRHSSDLARARMMPRILFLFILFSSLFSTANMQQSPQDPAWVLVTKCSELRQYLGHQQPKLRILILNDIACDLEAWGEPVTIHSEMTIRGFDESHRNIPEIHFGEIKLGIVVEQGASLRFESVRLSNNGFNEVYVVHTSDESVPKLPVLDTRANSSVHFTGVVMCYRNCQNSEVYIDQSGAGSEDEAGVRLAQRQNRLSPANFTQVAPTALTRLEAADFNSPMQSMQENYRWWLVGEFPGGGRYSVCASTLCCDLKEVSEADFMHLVDAMATCRKSEVEVVKTGSSAKALWGGAMIAVAMLLAIVSFAFLRKWKKRRTSYDGFGGNLSRGLEVDRDSSPCTVIEGTNPLSFINGHGRTSASGSSTGYNSPEPVMVVDGAEIDLSKRIGRGGFSSVFKGRFQGNTVAVKVIQHQRRTLTGPTGELVEASLLHNISHPNVVFNHFSKVMPLEDLRWRFNARATPCLTPSMVWSTGRNETPPLHEDSQTGGSLESTRVCTLIVMEYCDRGTLLRAIRDGEFLRNNLPQIQDIVHVALEIATAMEFLHAQDIVHGDLKPDNVLMQSAPSGLGYVCKVGDFGLSRLVPVDDFLKTATVGTITHMPPELHMDGILGPNTDVYSFGILLWELVSSAAPFEDMKYSDICLAVVNGQRPHMLGTIPRNLGKLMQDCWNQDPKGRPTFRQIIDRLQAIKQEHQLCLYAPFRVHRRSSTPLSPNQTPSPEPHMSMPKSGYSSTTPTSHPEDTSTTTDTSNEEDGISSGKATPQQYEFGTGVGTGTGTGPMNGLVAGMGLRMAYGGRGINNKETSNRGSCSYSYSNDERYYREQNNNFEDRSRTRNGIVGTQNGGAPGPSHDASPSTNRPFYMSREFGERYMWNRPSEDVCYGPEMMTTDENGDRGYLSREALIMHQGTGDDEDWRAVDPAYLHDCLEIAWATMDQGQQPWDSLQDPRESYVTTDITTIGTSRGDPEEPSSGVPVHLSTSQYSDCAHY